MAANNSRIPNLKAPAQTRAIITGAIATAVGVVAVVPFYNMVIAPNARRIKTAITNSGFLPNGQ